MGDHEHSVIKHNDHVLLDQPLLRLPYELLRKNFRTAHFISEKENAALKSLLKDTATASLTSGTPPADVLRSLDAMIARMRGVKRKLAACADEEARLHRHAAARVAHVGELYAMRTVDDAGYEAWSRARLDRLLVDYLLRRGYNDAAARLAEARRIGDLVDIETFVQMHRVQERLKQGSVAEALAWCQENKKELRRMDSNLEFVLRFQQYIELIRAPTSAKLAEAIAHARKFLQPFRDTHAREVQQACGLLAFAPPLRPQVQADVFGPDRWAQLADLFVRTNYALLGLPAAPLLHVALGSGLSALKTPACHAAGAAAGGASPGPAVGPAEAPQSVCPICSTELNELARNVPYAHHDKSHVDHDLLLLPNRRVYGKERLEEYARKAGLPPGQVKDLRTGEVYPADELKKVFIT